MIKTSMRSRIIIYILLFSFILLFILSISTLSIVRSNYRSEVENRLRLAASAIENSRPQLNSIDGQVHMNRLAFVSSIKISVFNEDGVCIYDSPYSSLPVMKEGDSVSDINTREAMAYALTKGEYFQIGRIANSGSKMAILFTKVMLMEGNTEKVFFVRTCAFIEGVGTSLQSMEVIMYVMLFVCAIISVCFGIWIAHHVTQPLTAIMNMTQSMSVGRLGARMPVRGSGEVAEIAQMFNSMANRLEQAMDSLQHKTEEIESITSAMTNGLIAVGSDLRIIQINPAACRMLGLSHEVTGQSILEATANAKLEAELQAAMGKTGMATVELPVRKEQTDRTIKLYISPLKQSDRNIGVVALMDDITEIAQLESMRVDFVANVTHELKTPLTSIQGFVETLQSGIIEDPNEIQHCLGIISSESNRLARLIDDILSISALQSGRVKQVVERISLYEYAQFAIDFLKTNADKKDISLFLTQADPDDTYILGNTDHVKQVLINLIDNAIKYTPNGGKVYVSVVHEGEKVVLKVQDTGIGIAQEHIPRLFERFYRVDKGRSRATGGTGLGLAIVKHIVKDLGGSIVVDSVLDEGSTFTVILPYANKDKKKNN